MSIGIPESAYGQSVTATASVSATSGLPEGDVVFSVNGVATKTNLGASGVATLVLPRATVGQYPVVATFVPGPGVNQEGSGSPTQTWTVVPVRTRLQVRVIGKGARIPTSVRVGAAGEYGTRPTGRVSVAIRRPDGRSVARVGMRLDGAGVALAGFGKLDKGRYRLAVTYVGDSQHLRQRSFVKFSVVSADDRDSVTVSDHTRMPIPCRGRDL